MKNIEHIRHSFAHLLAAAVLDLYPNTKPTIGPATENGFYYDFEFENPISEKDLKEIQKRMKKILNKWENVSGKEVTEEEARNLFKENPYKLELIDEIVSDGDLVTLYTWGDFTDLCKGGHAESSKDMNPDAFKLTKLAGVYWRGDENNPQLTRVYGLAFETKEELEEYEKMLEEAEKRDHRKIGKEMDLFTFSNLVGSGLPMFTPKGMAMRDAIEKKIMDIQEKYGFKKVWIPHITKPELYKTSGHWDKFGEELFKLKGKESEFVMKPMNCPHHTQIYASTPKSYKDLPVRYVETTTCYRDEQTGELLGLSRVRSLTQDDGHVFCTEDQIKEEIKNIIDVIKEFYSTLGMFNNYRVALSVRDPNNKEKYLGDDTVWNLSEKVLEEIANEEKLNFEIMEGEAAFYGPKLDFMFRDSIGREWQLATAQLDFNMPKRFSLEYTDSSGEKKTPVMIHRAVAGSLERFLSVIIEHFAGEFPFWLAPVQIKVLPIGEKHIDYAKEVEKKLRSYRVELDDSDDNFGKKVRKAKVEKIPYFIVIGDEEVKHEKITLESRDGNKEELTIENLLDKLEEEK
ncbi:MAG: threonine--tRNA ligase [Candidatus Pacebacteria bacterium]|nr:threonine--tRNA ligase [Candidatus Paceibacterota bacterium]